MSESGVALADVNVLVAVAWPDHEAHQRARQWFVDQRVHGWATTPITQSGFVRISSNHAVVPAATTPAASLAALERWTSAQDHHFWQDDIDGVVTRAIAPAALRGYRQVTDAHLLALAERHGGRLATFDAKIAQLVAPGYEYLVEVIGDAGEPPDPRGYPG